MRPSPAAILLLLAGGIGGCDTSPETGRDDGEAVAAWCALAPDSVVRLPEDDARHDAGQEWYYWTGHLRSGDGRWFGFHITVLLAGRPGIGLAIAHHSLTIAEDGATPPSYRHAVEFGLDTRHPARGFELAIGGIDATGYDGRDRIVSRLAGSELSLELTDDRGPVARHGTGFKDYGGGVSTWYYARPRMRAEGSLRLDGELVTVSGTAWFDHQWGALAPPESSRWDWIGAQLDDGRDVMLTRVPSADGGLDAYAEVRDRNCQITTFDSDKIALVGVSQWTNPVTSCTYPSGWSLTLGAERFELEPVALDQEVRGEPVSYWEGAALVSGPASGRAYVELVGYCAPSVR